MALSDYQRRVLDDGASAYWPLDDPAGSTIARDLFGTITEIPCTLEQAYLQARSGIARSCTTRSGYYLFNVSVSIDVDGVPVDISPYVAYNGWTISLNLNDEVDQATLSILPTIPFVPQTRSVVRLGFGAAGNLQFAGIVMTVQRIRRPGPDPRFWYELGCVDWLALFDAHLVVADYPTQSATTTILDIVARFTRGGFKTAGVPANLPSVANMSIVNERPSTVIRRVTNKIGGGFYLDADRQLHAWSATVPSPTIGSDPAPLTDHLSTLKTFQMTEDASQQRTRLFVEGQRTETLRAVPDTPGPTLSLPVADGSLVLQGDGSTPGHLTRINTQIGQSLLVSVPSLDASDNPPGTTVTANAAIGAVTLDVVDTSMFSDVGGWAQVGGQVISVAAFSPTVLAVSAPPSYGALLAPVTAGTQIIALPWVQFYPQDRDAADPAFLTADMRAQPNGSPVVLVVVEADGVTAGEIAAREGSDGYYEHLVQDGRYNEAGATARALAELADFAAPLVSYEWETEDLSAAPGRMQVIALSEGTPVSTTVRITNVDIRPVTSTSPPIRHVRAAPVKTAGVLDIWVDDPR